MLRKRSESFGAEIFSRLENIQETLENMQFDENNFSINSQTIKKLNRQIAIEAEELIGLAELAMDSWKLNRDRLNDYSNTLIKVIDGVEFSSLLNNEKLVYKISNLTELCEDLRQLNEEIKTLKRDEVVLKSWIIKLQTENNELKDLGSQNEELTKQLKESKESLALVTAERDGFEVRTAQLQQETQDMKNENKNLTVSRDHLTKEKADLTTKNEKTSDERDGLKMVIEALTKEKNDLLRVRDELSQDKTHLSKANRELIDERDDLRRQIQVLISEGNDFVTAQDDVDVGILGGLFGDDDEDSLSDVQEA